MQCRRQLYGRAFFGIVGMFKQYILSLLIAFNLLFNPAYLIYAKDQVVTPQNQETEDQQPEDQQPEDQQPEDQEPDDQEPEDQEPDDQQPDQNQSTSVKSQ